MALRGKRDNLIHSDKQHKDFVVPKEKWTFDEEVADCFENMLERSIPQYKEMRKTIHTLCKTKKGKLLDIGCSDGLNLLPFNNDIEFNCTGIDISVPMLEKAMKRFENSKNIKIYNQDITGGLNNKYNVITSILTIQFIPIEDRQKVLQDIYDHLENNGMFIFVEKVLGSNNVINDILEKSYYAMKEENGYSVDQIKQKRKSLAGVLVPVTSEWNKELLKQAGFTKIDTFWRNLNFEGYVAIK